MRISRRAHRRLRSRSHPVKPARNAMQPHPSTRNAWLRGLPFPALALVVVLSWTGLLDGAASRHVDEGLKRALTTFGTARLLNAGLSLAQGTQVQVTPFGLG